MDESPYTNGTSPSRAGGAYGTSLLRRRLRDERPDRAGGAYGTSLRPRLPGFTARNSETRKEARPVAHKSESRKRGLVPQAPSSRRPVSPLCRPSL